jgi:microcystin-dependent protein
MAEQSIDNPASQLPVSPQFIPEYWSVTAPLGSTSTTTSSSSILGQIIMCARITLPSNKFLWCDGAIYSITAYPRLYSILGNTFGGVAGSTFAVPNLINKTFYGADATSVLSTTYQGSSALTGGDKIITSDQLALHTHNLTFAPSTMIQNVYFNNTPLGISPYIFNPVCIINVSGNNLDVVGYAGNQGSGDNYLPPFFVCNYIIRAI